jgi:Pyridoxamine 5'-phosphate oxidase
MGTMTGHETANVGIGIDGGTRGVPEDDQQMGPGLTSEQVWRALAKASFAVLSYVTPEGQPRSSGVVYKSARRRLFVAVAPDSWKAKHIATSGRVAVTVPVRRGGILSLGLPIPPATISFRGPRSCTPPARHRLACSSRSWHLCCRSRDGPRAASSRSTRRGSSSRTDSASR